MLFPEDWSIFAARQQETKCSRAIAIRRYRGITRRPMSADNPLVYVLIRRPPRDVVTKADTAEKDREGNGELNSRRIKKHSYKGVTGR